MKPFNLEEYCKNPPKKVVTRDGRNARIICTDVKSRYPIAAAVEESECGCSEGVHVYTKDGRFFNSRPTVSDLFFAPEKYEGWVNIFKGADGSTYSSHRIFKSKEDAEKDGKDWDSYITSTKIGWEE